MKYETNYSLLDSLNKICILFCLLTFIPKNIMLDSLIECCVNQDASAAQMNVVNAKGLQCCQNELPVLKNLQDQKSLTTVPENVIKIFS